MSHINNSAAAACWWASSSKWGLGWSFSPSPSELHPSPNCENETAIKYKKLSCCRWSAKPQLVPAVRAQICSLAVTEMFDICHKGPSGSLKISEAALFFWQAAPGRNTSVTVRRRWKTKGNTPNIPNKPSDKTCWWVLKSRISKQSWSTCSVWLSDKDHTQPLPHLLHLTFSFAKDRCSIRKIRCFINNQENICLLVSINFYSSFIWLSSLNC